MKKLLFSLLMIMLIIVAALFSSDPLEKTFSVEPGQTLDIDLKAGGNVSIRGEDSNTLQVRVDFSHGDSRLWKIEFEQTDHGLEIQSRPANWENTQDSPSFEVIVPERFDLTIKTMGGNIELRHVRGTFQGKTMGGSLDLNDLEGDIHMTTMGGKITLRDSNIDGEVKTMGGRVLLENVIGNIKGSSMGGNVIYRNVKSRNGESGGEIVRISTMGGSINVEEAPNGADVHTMGGDIHIRSAAKSVKAKTMGGDIEIDAIDGGATATTMGGDIEVTMTGDPGKGDRDVYLTSRGGDITLKVPQNLSMSVDIELEYTRFSHRDYRIISDFDIEIREDSEWSDRNGSPRKTIRGKGKTGAGTHTIKLKTVNGNIYLKKTN